MGVNGEETNACWVHSGNHEICADMTLVSEKVLFEHRHTCYDTRFATSGEGVEFEVGRYDGGSKLSISGCAGSGTPYLRCDVVKFLAVLTV